MKQHSIHSPGKTLIPVVSNYSQGSAKLQLLQEAWLQCEGKWTSSNLYKRIANKETVSEKGAQVWLTKTQIARKYESEELALEIISAKENDPALSQSHVKPHPDCPGNKARYWSLMMLMILVFLADSKLMNIFDSIMVYDYYVCGDGI